MALPLTKLFQSDIVVPNVAILPVMGYLTLVYISWLVYRLFFSTTSKIPGPWYTNFSKLFVIYHDFYGTKRLWLHNLHAKYGNVVRMGPNEVSFASPTAVKDIYISAGGFVKTELYSLFMQHGHRNLFTAIDKKEHNVKKRRIADRYTNTAVLQSNVQEQLRERAEAFVNACTRGTSADIYFYLHCYALDCVSAMAFHPYGTKSIDGGAESEMVRRLSYHNSRPALVLRHYFPFLKYLYGVVFRRNMKHSNMLFEYAWSSMNEASHSDFTLASRLLEHPEMGMPNMVAECLDHIGAGIDTTGDTLCFLMWELSQTRNDQKQKRLSEELQTYHPENGDKLESLPYLGAVIEESLRLWAPGTQSLPRYVPNDGRIIDGYHIPGGAIVSAQSFTLHRLDETVFPNSWGFCPERWLEENGNTERQRLMFAFGAGARTCIGKFLAISEMRQLLYAVYSKYRTSPAEDMHASMEMDDQLLTTRPKDMICKLKFTSLELESTES